MGKKGHLTSEKGHLTFGGVCPQPTHPSKRCILKKVLYYNTLFNIQHLLTFFKI